MESAQSLFTIVGASFSLIVGLTVWSFKSIKTDINILRNIVGKSSDTVRKEIKEVREHIDKQKEWNYDKHVIIMSRLEKNTSDIHAAHKRIDAFEVGVKNAFDSIKIVKKKDV